MPSVFGVTNQRHVEPVLKSQARDQFGRPGNHSHQANRFGLSVPPGLHLDQVLAAGDSSWMSGQDHQGFRMFFQQSSRSSSLNLGLAGWIPGHYRRRGIQQASGRGRWERPGRRGWGHWWTPGLTDGASVAGDAKSGDPVFRIGVKLAGRLGGWKGILEFRMGANSRARQRRTAWIAPDWLRPSPLVRLMARWLHAQILVHGSDELSACWNLTGNHGASRWWMWPEAVWVRPRKSKRVEE
jgi:hypothetical protein